MKFRNTPTEFGLISKMLHWLFAIAMIAMIVIGWYMIGLDVESISYWRLYDLHVVSGVAMVLLFLFKISWKVVSPNPDYLPGLKRWERVAAHSVHLFFIIAIGLIPIAGFLFTASEGEPINVYGLFEIPDVGRFSKDTRDLLYDTHMYLAYVCAGLIVVHIMAAMKHNFIDRDDTLRRIKL